MAMKHLQVISRVPAPGSSTMGTATVVVQFLIALLSAAQPLLTAAMPLKAQQPKFAGSDDDIPNFP